MKVQFALLLLFLPHELWAQTQFPICVPANTPSVSQVIASIRALSANAKYADGSTVGVSFSPGLSASDSGGTVCDTSLFSSTISCTITLNPKYMTPLTAPVVFSHEWYHSYCSKTNCPLNFLSLNETNTNTGGYQNSPEVPAVPQEIFTHYSDYLEYRAATQNAIDNGDRSSATLAANWATYSLIIYDNMYAHTQETLDKLSAALTTYSKDSSLQSSGTSSDGNVTISFPTMAGNTSLAVADQQGVQISLKDPGADNDVIMVRYVLSDPTIDITSPNYQSAANFLQQSIVGSKSYLATLPPQLPSVDVYNLMVGAGYAPTGAFDKTNLGNNFFYYDSTHPQVKMMKIGVSQGDLVPPTGVVALPACAAAVSNITLKGIDGSECTQDQINSGGTPVNYSGRYDNMDPSIIMTYSAPNDNGSSPTLTSTNTGGGWISVSNQYTGFDIPPMGVNEFSIKFQGGVLEADPSIGDSNALVSVQYVHPTHPLSTCVDYHFAASDTGAHYPKGGVTSNTFNQAVKDFGTNSHVGGKLTPFGNGVDDFFFSCPGGSDDSALSSADVTFTVIDLAAKKVHGFLHADIGCSDRQGNIIGSVGKIDVRF